MSTPTSHPAVDMVFADLAATASLAPLPRIYQFAQGYGALYNAALASPGIALVAWAQDAKLAGTIKGAAELKHKVVLAVCENTAPGKNTTALASAGWALAIIRALGAARDIELDSDTYQLGKADEGLCIYYVNLRVRTFETLTR